MEPSKMLANRFRELFLNGTWVAGTNIKTLLSDVSYQQATTTLLSLNSIYQLTFHINYYLDGVLRVFKGGPLDIKDEFSFDCPIISSEDQWLELVTALIVNAEDFARHIEALTETELRSVFVDEKYGSYRRNIEGLIEHSYYHFGQISLIKKIVINKNKL